MSEEFDCDSLKGLKRMLCQGYKYDEHGNEVQLTSNEHARWMASFTGKPVPPRESLPKVIEQRLAVKKEGVGTELERLFESVRFATCGACRALRDQMNEWGPAKCRENREELIDKLKQNARKRKVLRHIFSETAAGMFIDQAITNTEMREANQEPPSGVFANVISKFAGGRSPKKKPSCKEIKWSYGVTTVPLRVNDLLPRTLDSLAAAGFGRPHLFVDSCESPKDYDKFGLSCTFRMTRTKTFANWIAAAWELYASEPNADRYAIFQDDFVCCKGLRKYLDESPYPGKGYLNLLTFPENDKLIKDKKRGWHKSNQRGLGAVALVFDNAAISSLLSSSHMVSRQRGPRAHRAVDGAILESFRKLGQKEFVHNPSLVQHTGEDSSMGNVKHPLSPSWQGEDWNAYEEMKGR